VGAAKNSNEEKSLLMAFGAVAALRAQHTLTMKQAEKLALNAPPTLNQPSGKCCPGASSAETPAGSLRAPYTLITVQVRCTCGEYRAALIDNYMVNPRTGQIWERLEEEGKPLESKRLDALRKAFESEKSSK
jgi:hypothetical protein